MNRIIITIILAFSAGLLSAKPGDFVWRFKTMNWVSSSPCVWEDFVYFGGIDHNLYCVSSKNGKLRWKFSAGDKIYSSPTVWQGKVFFGGTDRNLYCLDAKTGAMVWTTGVKDTIISSPYVYDNKVYVGSWDNRMYCFDTEYGDEIWSYKTAGQIFSSPCLWNNRIYFGGMDGYVYCLNASDGSEVWKYQTGGEVYSSPFVSGGKVYVGSKDFHLYCIDASKGTMLWKFKTGDEIISSPVAYAGKVFIGSGDSNLYALNSDTGELKWKFRTYKPVLSSPVIANGSVYFGSQDRFFYCMNMETGKVIWQYGTDNMLFSSACFYNDKVMFGGLDYNFYCLDAGPGISGAVYPSISGMDSPLSETAMNIPEGKSPYSSPVAVVIGNKDYQPGIPPVQFALNDAKLMKQYLIKTFGIDEKNILYRENADLTEFIDIFGAADSFETSQVYKLAKSKNADAVYIYYSGHGIPGLSDKKGYLAPVSLKKFNPEATGYALDTLYRNLTKLKDAGVKKVVLILDSCFSGDSAAGMLIDNVSPIMAKVQNELAAAEIGTVFLATTGDSYAAWYKDMGQGLFTYFLLRGLGGDADADKNKTITLAEMQEYMGKAVPEQSMLLLNFRQIPQVSGKPGEVIINLK
jgi:outer membrane protein assembly factor BamB